MNSETFTWAAASTQPAITRRRFIARQSSSHGLPLLREGTVNRERALKIVLGVVGVLFLATVYPMITFLRQEPALAMMLSLYVTLGVFLLLAVRNPAANRSLISFTAWSSLAHGVVMGWQAFRNMIALVELIGVAVLLVIGVVLIMLAPARQTTEEISVLR